MRERTHITTPPIQPLFCLLARAEGGAVRARRGHAAYIILLPSVLFIYPRARACVCVYIMCRVCPADFWV